MYGTLKYGALLLLLPACMHTQAAVYTAAEVLNYTAGTGVSASLQNPSAALGLPNPTVPGAFGYPSQNYNPFAAHWDGNNIVQVGFGGQITLRLERFIVVTPGMLELGVWENVFLVQGSGPAGTAGNPAAVSGSDSAGVEVSADGVNFVSVGTKTFNWFGNYWSDSPGTSSTGGSQIADFGKPFTGVLSNFNGLGYADVLNRLDGSAGGTWIDLDASGLSQVGWIRFSGVVPGTTLELDALAINSSLSGALTIPEPSTFILLSVSTVLLIYYARKRIHRY